MYPFQKEFAQNKVIHYVRSEDDLGTESMKYKKSLKASPFMKAVHTVSAGHPKHEYTTGVSWPLVISQFEN